MNTENLVRQLDCLRHHQVFPPDLARPTRARAFAPGDDLVPFLLHAWTKSLSEPAAYQQRRLARRTVAWLERQRAGPGVLSWGMPGPGGQRVRDWANDRLIWWPAGVPSGRWIGMISSRLNRRLEEQRSWFAALRHACGGLDPDQTVMITSAGTTTAVYLERCSELYGIPLLRFQLPRPRQRVAQWFPPRLNRPARTPSSSSRTWLAIVSPPLDTDPESEPPLRDRLVVAASDRVFALRMRAGGYTEQLVRRRVTEDALSPWAEVSLAIGPGLVPAPLANSLPTAKWLDVEAPPVRENVSVPPGTTHEGAGIVPLRQLAVADYLTHCTRAATGPWPDQTVEAYRDALILDREEADHSALATLARIAAQSKLLATGRAIRGGARVVCFTAVPLQQLKSLRTFRAHRGRWDFEPYGICISRKWLEQRGTRRVRYGAPSLWNQLTASERPFFQRRRGGKHDQIDWSVECEWRHVGDVDLTDLPSDAGTLFVPTVEEARWLGQRSRWPVTVLE
ncbi:MAG: hypothetical protein ACQESR_09275 [Planctomycetota bacterium]